MTRAWRVLPPIAVAVVLFASATPWPDDWDGIGFLESVNRFDLDRFAPHPPGYPVYVALLNVAALLVRDPMRAAIVVAVTSGVVAFLATRDAIDNESPLARNLVALACVANPLAWRAFTGVGSEAPALALTALSCWALVRSRERMGGVLLGLALGARLSWAPLFLVLPLIAPRASLKKIFAFMAVGTLAWLAPLIALVGPAHWLSLLSVHFAGHAQRWGGTAITDPRWGERSLLLLRDVFIDGVGVDADALGAFIALSVGTLLFVSRRHGFRRSWLLLLIPYSIWIFVGQNLRAQPRHALPVVVGLVLWCGLTAVRANAGRVALPILIAILVRTASDATNRATVAPVGAQLVAWMRDRPSAVVFGGASARFFADTDLRSRAFTAASMGDMEIALGKLDTLPRSVFVTGEVEGHPTSSIVRLCRPPRIDRSGCLSVYRAE